MVRSHEKDQESERRGGGTVRDSEKDLRPLSLSTVDRFQTSLWTFVRRRRDVTSSCLRQDDVVGPPFFSPVPLLFYMVSPV